MNLKQALRELNKIKRKIDAQILLKEQVADLCHRQWSGWMEYLFSKGIFNEDGTWTMPKEFVDRWKRQMETPYSELSEDEQNSDKKEADKFLELM